MKRIHKASSFTEGWLDENSCADFTKDAGGRYQQGL